jgi:hypothetical protein
VLADDPAHPYRPCAQSRFRQRGGDAQRLPLDQVLVSAQARGIEVLALEALNTLTRIDARKSRVVELWWIEH